MPEVSDGDSVEAGASEDAAPAPAGFSNDTWGLWRDHWAPTATTPVTYRPSYDAVSDGSEIPSYATTGLAPRTWREGDIVTGAEMNAPAADTEPVRLYHFVADRCLESGDDELVTDHNRWLRETEERRRRYAERAQQREQARREREERQKAAGERGEELLRTVLSSDELKHYDETKEIIVTGSDGKRYRICDGIVGNVHLLAEDPSAGYQGTLANLCCHPNMYPTERDEEEAEGLPHRDAHVAQILWLRHDLQAFWDTANVDWYDYGCDEHKAWRDRRDELREQRARENRERMARLRREAMPAAS